MGVIECRILKKKVSLTGGERRRLELNYLRLQSGKMRTMEGVKIFWRGGGDAGHIAGIFENWRSPSINGKRGVDRASGNWPVKDRLFRHRQCGDTRQRKRTRVMVSEI